MKIKRLYINITNKCNKTCEFCFMYSSPKNNIFLSLEQYNKILSSQKEPFEVQLGGGEPTLHPKLIQFCQIAIGNPLCKKLIIDTNGSNLQLIQQLFSFSYSKQVIIKISLNYELLRQNKYHDQQLKDFLQKYPKTNGWLPCLAIRYRGETNDLNTIQSILATLPANNYAYNIHQIAALGRAKDNNIQGTSSKTEGLVTYGLPEVYACDGTCFYEDFNRRMLYEQSLSKAK